MRELTVDVGDGELAVTEFGPAAAPAVLAIHGITSSSRAWLALARHLPAVRLIAPDLRGRGRSRALPPSTGLRHHARDLGRLIDALELGSVPVVAHSMGAFVAVALAAERPETIASLLLVDGGYPLQRPPGVADDDLSATVLGPIAARLSREFPTREAYLDFWREHPAFRGAFTPDIAEYADYDLVGDPPRLRTASTIDAIAADSLDLYGPEWYLDALAGLRIPAPLLRAPRGLLDEPGGLYPGLPASPPLAPTMRVIDVDDVNHYTILMTDPGAGVVADALRATLT
ncbi:alpha/beta fold hydrolase [Pseudolysinimonas yzui]|uniref:alpha/beta fold hydrolase n=1 Tax=Pseudolysinimonas yzui TaxID=2708254 RepID=UPI00174A7822|nr:alpha/beta fold hydrolase [Pseudolysinimonas yzui]